eukprot:174343-Pelagomonas_calceolata.AAC.1
MEPASAQWYVVTGMICMGHASALMARSHRNGVQEHASAQHVVTGMMCMEHASALMASSHRHGVQERASAHHVVSGVMCIEFKPGLQMHPYMPATAMIHFHDCILTWCHVHEGFLCNLTRCASLH